MWSELYVWLSVISYVFSQTSNYLYIPQELTWDRAGSNCKSKGYTLASPRDSFENNNLMKFLATVTESDSEVWIGGHIDESNTWRWYDGGTIDYFDWSVSKKQPNDVNIEKCIRIKMQDQLWWNRQCSFTYHSVCQVEPIREARFKLFERNRLPTEVPLDKFSVTSAPECTLRCIDDYRCQLYSIHVTSQDPVVQYQCLLFSAGVGNVTLQDLVDTRLYSRQA